jgi:hypothetical protein
VRLVIAAEVLLAFAAAALAPRRDDLSTRDTVVSWAVPIGVAVLLAATLYASKKVQLLVVLTTLPVALVLLPLEYALGSTSQRLNRAFIRRAQLPVLHRAGIDVYPILAPWDLAYGRHTVQMRGAPALPLTGVSNRFLGFCNGGESELVYQSDASGFRNPRQFGSDTSSIDVALIGDSFAQGYCQPDSAGIAGRIRTRIPATMNFGVTGAGPLWELGVLREYVSARRPRTVVWLFFEGNDLESAGVEQSGFASSYLDSSFTQRLRDRQPEIDRALSARLDSLGRSFLPDPGERFKRLILLREIRARLGLNLRAREGAIPVSGSEVSEDLEIVKRTLARASADAGKWGGSVLFVYLPERPRYTKEIRKTPEAARQGHYASRAAVIQAATAAGMAVLDMAAVFDTQPSPLSLWDDGAVHYNRRGYALVADSILGRLTGAVALRQGPMTPVNERWIPVTRLGARDLSLSLHSRASWAYR